MRVRGIWNGRMRSNPVVHQIIFHYGQAHRDCSVFKHRRKNAMNARSNRGTQQFSRIFGGIGQVA